MLQWLEVGALGPPSGAFAGAFRTERDGPFDSSKERQEEQLKAAEQMALQKAGALKGQ